MTILRVRRFEPAVDWLLGFIWTEARQQRWVCDECRVPVKALNARQRRQWQAVQDRERRHIECRRLVPPFRRVCGGRLVRAAAS